MARSHHQHCDARSLGDREASSESVVSSQVAFCAKRVPLHLHLHGERRCAAERELGRSRGSGGSEVEAEKWMSPDLRPLRGMHARGPPKQSVRADLHI